MIVVGTFVIIAVALVAATLAALHLGFRAGDRLRDAEVNRRLDVAADYRWHELGRLSRLP